MCAQTHLNGRVDVNGNPCIGTRGITAYHTHISSSVADVIRAGAPADFLSQESFQSSQASNLYMDFNNLKDFISAFPFQSSAALKRSAPDV
jgi:hypothetical protein